MNGSSLLLFRLLTLSGLAISAAVLGCLIINSWATNVPDRHDDWRRTANGWERTSHWPRAVARDARDFRTGDASKRPPLRFDTHPAALALGQLTVILLALFAWPAASQPAKTGWLTAISRSFRASFFGI